MFLHRKQGEITAISGIIFPEKFVDFFPEKCIIWIRMDTLIKRGSLGIDELKELKLNHIIVGTKQLRKGLNRGGVQRVYLALDADPAITLPLEAMCLQRQVECVWVRSMQTLGQACGIEVGAAAAAVVSD